MTRFFFSIFSFLNAFSLDVILIALSWQALFSRLLGCHLSFAELFLLSTAVWIIYMLDHLLDAWSHGYFWQVRSQKNFPLICLRHQFVARHAFMLVGITLLVGGYATFYLHLLSFYLLISGAVLMGIVFFYLFINARVQHQKRALLGREYLIAIIFGFGSALAPLCQFIEVKSINEHLPLIIKFLLGLIGFIGICRWNALLIGRMEQKLPQSLLMSLKDYYYAGAFFGVLFLLMLFLGWNFLGTAILLAAIGLSIISKLKITSDYHILSLAVDWVLIISASMMLVYLQADFC